MIDYKYCMLDLETLGTRPGDVILSIGAVLFAPEKGITSELYMTINQQSSRDAGLRAQKSTIEWWQKQSPEAQTAAFKGELSLESALKQFAMWLPKETLVYGNGANFDNAMLAAAYRAMKMDTPWPFWYDRCYRTISAMHMKSRVERVGTYHNALDDAKTQTLRLLHMVKESGLVLK
jgi:hypothetical protein